MPRRSKTVMRAGLILWLALGMVWAEDTPRLEPLTGLPESPSDNPSTPEKVKLGEMLFFDTMLSRDNRRSCSTCHVPKLYFTDGFSRAWGLRESELPRKTPNLLNAGWQRSMFFDGRAKTLEEQASMPLENPEEMNLDPAEAAERVAADPFYRQAFAKVFPGEAIRFELVAKAIAAYERTLVSHDSDLDRYLLGDEEALSPAARRGMELFTGKAECIRCHNGPLLTDHKFHYTGVRERDGDNPAGTKYKTQSLRDVTRRFSFMHNGEILKINAVLDHYIQGGAAPEGLEAEIRPFSLNEEERLDLIEFLWALNGRPEDLIDNAPEMSGPFSGPVNDRRDRSSEGSGPVLDPSYRRQPGGQSEGPVLDPAYQKPAGGQQPTKR